MSNTNNSNSQEDFEKAKNIYRANAEYIKIERENVELKIAQQRLQQLTIENVKKQQELSRDTIVNTIDAIDRLNSLINRVLDPAIKPELMKAIGKLQQGFVDYLNKSDNEPVNEPVNNGQ